MRALFLALTFALLVPVVAVASDGHGAPAKPAAGHESAPKAAPATAGKGHGPVTAALPGRPVTGIAPVAAPGHAVQPAKSTAAPAAHATATPTTAGGAHGASVTAATAGHGAATPTTPVRGVAPVGGHGGAPPAPGPVDGRGPDRGRNVVRLTSGRAGARTRRVAVVWPEPARLKLRWDEPAERVALVWPTDE